MYHLIVIIMAIGLLATITVAGSGYLSPNAGLIREVAAQVASGTTALATGFELYRLEQQTVPPVSGWDSAMLPYTMMPLSPDGMSWSYGTDSAGSYWFCLSGTASAAQKTALERAGTRVPADRYYLSDTCGSKATAMPLGASVAATYWVKKQW